MVKFREKSFSSFKEDVIAGATIGSAIGTSLIPIFGKQSLKYGALIGTSLGTLVGMIKWSTRKISQKSASENNITKISNQLISLGYKENLEFTRDPKMANLLKTKVCIVFSKSHSEFKLLINIHNDSSLQKALDSAIKKSAKLNFSKIQEKSLERYKEVKVVSLPSEDDLNVLIDILRIFIDSGFPVYFVEIN